MRKHTQEFKEKIKQMGRQLDSKITFDETELGNEQINAVTPVLQSALLKSVMKELDIDSNVEISEGTILNYKFGVLLDSGDYEYLNYGNYQVYSCEKLEDNNAYNIVAYDKMLNSMVEYTTLKNTSKVFPMTVRDYIGAICNDINLVFKNSETEFANYDKVIQTDLYANLGYTYRDILDELAQVTASNIIINENDELEIKYITDTNDTIDEEYLKDINVKFGEKYGKINSIVLSRAAESDNVYLQDEQSIADNGLCELKIVDNQIMNFNDRSDYLPAILAQLDGLEYYTNDFSSTGICYYEVADRYNVKVGENTYSCVMFNDEIDITQGLEEVIHTDLPEQAETDYTKADKTDRKINQTYIIVDKQNQQIESVVSQVDDQNEKISQVTQTVDELNIKMQNIADLTTTVEGIGIIDIDEIMTSEFLFLHIYPTKTDLSYLYPSKNLFPSENLFMTSRDLVATKVDSETGEDVEVLRYTLPCDLYYIDDNIKDEFVIDYENKQMYCIHRVGFNEDGDKVPLEEEQKEYFVYNGIQFEAGTYKLFMESFEDAYINVRYSKQNEFTSQFATHVEVDKSIVLAKDNITLSITEMLDNKYFTGAKIMMEINNDESGILIQANKLRLEGFTSINNSFSIDEKGNVSIHIADSSQYDPTFTIGDIDKGLIKLWNGAGTFSDYYGNTNIQGNGIQCARTPDGPDGGLAPAFQLEFDNENNSSILHFQGFESEILLEMYYGSTSIKPEGINTPQVTQTSLESQKKNFEIFNNALSIIEDIDIYKYNLKSEDDDHKKHIGFVIGKDYKYSSEITAIDDKGKEIGVDTYSMSSLNTQAIKELLERIKVLERKVENG